jgi:hypothetical protein
MNGAMENREREEEQAAAEEAANIGGPAPDTEADEAARPVEEAGGGEAEGFEEAERELADQATHGDSTWDPEIDAFPPEAESDESGAEYAEPDEVDQPD